MESRRLKGFARELSALWNVGTVGDVDDLTLVARYSAVRDETSEAAFRVLVERHGPMVLRVCRRLLVNGHDAQDAAQAVFLVLARKAGSIRSRGSIAPWLHGVACRVAAKARQRGAAASCEGNTDGPGDRHDPVRSGRGRAGMQRRMG